MNRDELIGHFRKLISENRIEARSHQSDGDLASSDHCDAQADAYEQVVDFLEQHLPANSITLTLPTYAEGDPKAGEVVKVGDVIHYTDCYNAGRHSIRVCGFSTKSTHGVANLVDEEACEVYMGRTRIYSTAEARDAAMEAATEGNNVQ